MRRKPLEIENPLTTRRVTSAANPYQRSQRGAQSPFPRTFTSGGQSSGSLDTRFSRPKQIDVRPSLARTKRQMAPKPPKEDKPKSVPSGYASNMDGGLLKNKAKNPLTPSGRFPKNKPGSPLKNVTKRPTDKPAFQASVDLRPAWARPVEEKKKKLAFAY